MADLPFPLLSPLSISQATTGKVIKHFSIGDRHLSAYSFPSSLFLGQRPKDSCLGVSYGCDLSQHLGGTSLIVIVFSDSSEKKARICLLDQELKDQFN